MDKERLEYLLEQYRRNLCTSEERMEIDNWYKDLGDESLKFHTHANSPGAGEYLDHQYGVIKSRIIRDKIRNRYSLFMKAVAAILLLGVGTWYFIFKPNSAIVKHTLAIADIEPGTDRAVLSLANGKTILLDERGNGDIGVEDGVQIIKTDSGELAYTGHSAGSNSYNTLSTPRGGKYKITLSDGTKVWLNAETVLKFPAAFTGTERGVELTGEAYFEVAKDSKRPFHVLSGSQKVEVLGTHFNIFGYPNEKQIRTTLLEGKVSVETGGKKMMLSPGEESVLEGKALTTRSANLDQAIAWKEGLIDITNQSLEEIFTQISRWYDVEVIFQGKIPEKQLSGQLDRGLMLSQLVQGLQKMQIPVSLQGKRLIVSF